MTPRDAIRLLVLAACAWLTVACATQGREAGPEGPASTPPQAPGDDELAHLHPLAQAVARAGAPECVAKVTEAAFFLTEGSGATAFWNFRSADLLSFSLELVTPAGMTSYVSLSIAPGENGACAIGYDVVTHWASGCDDVARHVYPATHAPERQPSRFGMLIGPDGEHVFLMPVDQGCIATMKEVFP